MMGYSCLTLAAWIIKQHWEAHVPHKWKRQIENRVIFNVFGERGKAEFEVTKDFAPLLIY